MSKYLLTSTEIYRVDSEPEATALINAAKNYGWNAEVFSSAENLKNQLNCLLQNKGE